MRQLRCGTNPARGYHDDHARAICRLQDVGRPGLADARTLLEILEQRRASGVRMRRGWLVRRMLVIADLVGLTAAFAATLVFDEPSRGDAVAGQWSCSSSA